MHTGITSLIIPVAHAWQLSLRPRMRAGAIQKHVSTVPCNFSCNFIGGDLFQNDACFTQRTRHTSVSTTMQNGIPEYLHHNQATKKTLILYGFRWFRYQIVSTLHKKSGCCFKLWNKSTVFVLLDPKDHHNFKRVSTFYSLFRQILFDYFVFLEEIRHPLTEPP